PMRTHIETELHRTDTALEKVATQLRTLGGEANKLNAQVAALRAQENTLREKMAADVQAMNITLAYLARMERQPTAAMLAYDAFTYQPNRAAVLNMSRKIIHHEMEKSRDALQE